MQDSYIYVDFPSSIIAERIAAALTTLPTRQLLALTDERKIIIHKSNLEPYQTLTYRNLRYQYIDDYAEACGIPLSYVLFGEDQPQQTFFSDFDAVVIPLINAVPQMKLSAAVSVLRSFFCNPKMLIRDMTPSGKLISVLLMGSRLPKNVPPAEMFKYRNNINEELTRFRKARMKERCVFHIDRIVDLCTYCRVSPHWAFSLRQPLFCATSEGEEFFSVFCFLSKSQQVYAIAMLLNLLSSKETKMPPAVLQEARRIISEEGGAV